MTWREFLVLGWVWYPGVVLSCLALSLLYLIFSKLRRDRYAICFHSGVLLLFLTLVSPLDVLADDYLFSAHMLQHILLVLVVAPLLILGIPSEWLKRLLKWEPTARIEGHLGQPLVAWIIGIGTLYLWHLPLFYNAALRDENVHLLQHLSFLVSATIFWWPVILPVQEKRRLSPLGAMLYLFFGAAANTVLGILLTFAPVGLYPAYINPQDAYGILPLIRNGLGILPQTDQQLGGLLMWIPGGLIYLASILVVFGSWFSQPDMEVT